MTIIIPCKFCEDYDLTKKINEKEAKESRKRNEPIRTLYKIALVEEKKRVGWGYPDAGRFTHKPMFFSYCPVCGKKLKD